MLSLQLFNEIKTVQKILYEDQDSDTAYSKILNQWFCLVQLLSRLQRHQFMVWWSAFQIQPNKGFRFFKYENGHWKGLPLLKQWQHGHDQSWAWALEKYLIRPSFFLYFREIRNKWSHWPGGQSAPRLYYCFNLCSCARPTNVGECGSGPKFKFSKTVEVGWSY